MAAKLAYELGWVGPSTGSCCKRLIALVLVRLAPLELVPGLLGPAVAPPLELAQPVAVTVMAVAVSLEVATRGALGVQGVVAVGYASAGETTKAKGLAAGAGKVGNVAWREARPSRGMRRGGAQWPQGGCRCLWGVHL